MSSIETLIDKMSDHDLTEMSVIAAGYELFYVHDTPCARFERDETGRCVKFGPFDPLNNSDHTFLLVWQVADSTSVVCISVGHDKTLCEFVTTMHSSNTVGSMRRAIVKGCIKKWMEHNGFQSVISMGDLHRRLVHRGLVDPSIAK